jgi:hypothetical protein
LARGAKTAHLDLRRNDARGDQLSAIYVGEVQGAKLCPFRDEPLEPFGHVWSHFITTLADTGTDSDEQRVRLRTELVHHSGNGFPRQLCRRAAPTGMYGSDSPEFFIH